MKKILSLLLIALFIVSCEDNGMNYSHADYLKMMAAINLDEMVGLDAIDDDGVQDEDYDEVLYDMDFTSSRIDPFPTDGSAVFRFGRKVEDRTRDVQFDCTDCDVAIATITETHSGTFYAKAYNKETKEDQDFKEEVLYYPNGSIKKLIVINQTDNIRTIVTYYLNGQIESQGKKQKQNRTH